jgi:hypothetical protein
MNSHEPVRTLETDDISYCSGRARWLHPRVLGRSGRFATQRTTSRPPKGTDLSHVRLAGTILCRVRDTIGELGPAQSDGVLRHILWNADVIRTWS